MPATFLRDFKFQQAVNSQPLNEFLCSTPEMKARDAYVPFLLFKSLNKNEIQNYLEIHKIKISIMIFLAIFVV